MARFFGQVGYAGVQIIVDGIATDEPIERSYRGDVTRNTSRVQGNEKVNKDIVLNNLISIVADPFAYENFFAIKYVRWMGAYWEVTNVEVQRPRLILTIGGVYNGEKADPAASP